MKKLTILASLAALLATSVFSALPVSAEFSDINDATAENDANGYFDAVRYVEKEGIVDGYPDGTYKPKQRINRAEFTKIIINAYYSTDKIINCKKDSFKYSDVPKEAWFAPYVCVATQEGIIEGYPDGTFKPAQEISFVEAAKIISVAEVIKEFGAVTETPQSDPWYRVYVGMLADRSAIPVDITSFEHQITRGEMAEIIHRVVTKKAGSSQTYDSLENNGIVFKSPTLKVGDKVGDLTVAKVETSRTSDQFTFTGQTTVTGDYQHIGADAYFSDSVCLTNLTPASKKKLPEFANHWLCFMPNKDITKAFGGEGAKGRATVTIKDYSSTVIKVDTGGVADWADFVKVEEFHSQLLPSEENWNEFLNYDDQYTIKVPQKAASSLCRHAGNHSDGSPYFKLENAEQTLTVFTNEESNKAYISTENDLVVEQSTDDQGYSEYTDCTTYTNSFERMEKDIEGSYTPGWAIISEPVANDQELDKFLKKHYGSGCSLGEKTPAETKQDGVFEVAIEGDGKDLGETACPINFALKVFYSPNLERAVTWGIGQDVNFVSTDTTVEPYDFAMIDSFRFLEQ